MGLHLRRRLLASLLGAVLSAGCLSPVTQEELESQLAEVAAASPDPGARRTFPVHAPTRTVALLLLTEAKSDPRSSLSSQLGRRLANASGRRTSLVVGGPYADLCDQVVRNAFALSRDRNLRGLTVIFVAPEPPSQELQLAAASAHVRLQHRPLR
jgi:hypothetical protein